MSTPAYWSVDGPADVWLDQARDVLAQHGSSQDLVRAWASLRGPIMVGGWMANGDPVVVDAFVLQGRIENELRARHGGEFTGPFTAEDYYVLTELNPERWGAQNPTTPVAMPLLNPAAFAAASDDAIVAAFDGARAVGSRWRPGSRAESAELTAHLEWMLSQRTGLGFEGWSQWRQRPAPGGPDAMIGAHQQQMAFLTDQLAPYLDPRQASTPQHLEGMWTTLTSAAPVTLPGGGEDLVRNYARRLDLAYDVAQAWNEARGDHPGTDSRLLSETNERMDAVVGVRDVETFRQVNWLEKMLQQQEQDDLVQGSEGPGRDRFDLVQSRVNALMDRVDPSSHHAWSVLTRARAVVDAEQDRRVATLPAATASFERRAHWVAQSLQVGAPEFAGVTGDRTEVTLSPAPGMSISSDPVVTVAIGDSGRMIVDVERFGEHHSDVGDDVLRTDPLLTGIPLRPNVERVFDALVAGQAWIDTPQLARLDDDEHAVTLGPDGPVPVRALDTEGVDAAPAAAQDQPATEPDQRVEPVVTQKQEVLLAQAAERFAARVPATHPGGVSVDTDTVDFATTPGTPDEVTVHGPRGFVNVQAREGQRWVQMVGATSLGSGSSRTPEALTREQGKPPAPGPPRKHEGAHHVVHVAPTTPVRSRAPDGVGAAHIGVDDDTFSAVVAQVGDALVQERHRLDRDLEDLRVREVQSAIGRGEYTEFQLDTMDPAYHLGENASSVRHDEARAEFSVAAVNAAAGTTLTVEEPSFGVDSSSVELWNEDIGSPADAVDMVRVNLRPDGSVTTDMPGDGAPPRAVGPDQVAQVLGLPPARAQQAVLVAAHELQRAQVVWANEPGVMVRLEQLNRAGTDALSWSEPAAQTDAPAPQGGVAANGAGPSYRDARDALPTAALRADVAGTGPTTNTERAVASPSARSTGGGGGSGELSAQAAPRSRRWQPPPPMMSGPGGPGLGM